MAGISDHNVVLVDTNICPEIKKATPRKVYQYGKADWPLIKAEIANAFETYLTNFDMHTVKENWTEFKNILTPLRSTSHVKLL